MDYNSRLLTRAKLCLSMVVRDNGAEMEIISIFGNLSFALSALSFLMHDMSRLRMIAIISALFGIFYNYNVTDSPLWLVIFWLSTFLGINLSMLAAEYFRNKSARFDTNEQELFETLFPELSAFEFLQLLKAGSWKSLRRRERFITAQQKNVKLGLIWRGQAKVLKGKEVVAHLKKGTLVGEISFLTGEKPNADVVLERGSLVLMWDHEKLRQWISKNPHAAASFQRLMTSDLAAKI